MSASRQHQVISVLQRKPLDSQKYVGGDMSMMAFLQPAAAPVRFAYPDEHHVKGLNAETLAKVQLPTPQWLSTPEYAPIADQWFFMAGRVHPFALTWELERRDGLESDDDQIDEYTVPAFVVRDHSFQPVSPRPLRSSASYPTIMPVVSFTGPIVGSGLDLLHEDLAPAFDEAQLKCCGFVQLSTFLCPGKPEKTPLKGYHPFQVFVIFPVHANPWTSLYKKIVERRHSQFQPGAPFTCTGKVAGLLAHNVARQPPAFGQDYIFIVVPDTWTFLDKASFDQPPTTRFPPTTPRRPTNSASEYDDAMARFTSTKKRQRPPRGATPETPKSLAMAPASASVKRPLPSPQETPAKKRRLSPAPSTILATCDADDSLSQEGHDDADVDDDSDIAPPAGQDAVDPVSCKASTPDLSRPHRVRQPPKKYQESN
ncbi:hypothetical protein HIM_04637 [Hirsutella minnesotensis 3608]|uniref:Uncharacterized protein n=1 Tax=Hirsutella minnesotensis 3608 TaxID=1043627 RepID=A0A0F7ZV13_9HYPO|nr:hypothetical protein HIM_04637 [Hirsutella minnesotensis 3608]